MDSNLNKKICRIKSTDIFILNKNSLSEFANINPEELIIINTDFLYSYEFFQCLNNILPDNKCNTRKIITSDLVIVKYFKYLNKKLNQIFPNCDTIVINTFENNFVSISNILDDLSVKNVEYNLDNYTLMSNSIYKYQYFFEHFFNDSISNIENITIRNKINCEYNNYQTSTISENIIRTIITKDKINQKNINQINNIIKWGVCDECFVGKNYLFGECIFNSKHINLLNIKYIDIKNNILISDKIIIIKEHTLLDEHILL